MLTYTFEEDKTKPLYEQLYAFIKRDIQSGLLLGNEKLPSKRALSLHLGISVMTVETAYEKLLSEGYLYSQSRKGFFVTPLTSPPPRASLGQGQFAYEKEGQRPKNEAPAFKYNLCTSEMNEELFPFSVWARIMRKILSQRKKELMKTLPLGGCMELKEAIAAWLLQSRSLYVRPQQIIIGAGTEYLYTLLLQLLGKTQVYALENPGYTKISRIYKSFGARFTAVPLDSEGINIEALEKSGAKVAHVTPSHPFPRGTVMPARRRYELLAWAAKEEGRYIIEDDYDAEFRLNGKPFAPLKSLDGTGQVIYINSFTKSLASTMRISYMVLPPSLLADFEQKLGFYSSTVPAFEQYTLASFISEGFFEKHINRLRTRYRAVRNAFLKSLEESALFPFVSISGQDAGLHFLLTLNKDFPHTYTNEEVKERAKAFSLCISFLNEYTLEKPEAFTCAQSSPKEQNFTDSLWTQDSLIINYTSLSTEDAANAARLLERVLMEK